MDKKEDKEKLLVPPSLFVSAENPHTRTHHPSISKTCNLPPTSKTRHANNGLPHFIPPSPKEQACFNMGNYQPFLLCSLPLFQL